MKNDCRDDKDRTWRTSFLMKPENYIRFSWELFVMSFLIILGFLLPYINAFEPDNTELSYNIDCVSFSIFSLDIVINLNTGFYQKGNLVMDRVKILRNYLSFWFWIDIFSTIPIDNFFGSSNSSGSNPRTFLRYIKIIRVLKLLKLIRLTKLKIMIIKIKDRISNKKVLSLITVFKLLIYLLLVAHFYACLMYSVSYDNLDPDSFEYIIVNKSDEKITSNSEMYITCLYWAITTMSTVGYGDFSPKTTTERIVGILIMITSSYIFGFIIGNISSTLEKQGQKQRERREIITNLNYFMKTNKFSSHLKNKTRKFLDFTFAHKKSDNAKAIDMLNLLSEPLQKQILSYTNGALLTSKEIFKHYDEFFINKLTRILESQIFSPGDFLIQEGFYSKGMFFVIGGMVIIYDEPTRSRIQNLTCDSIIGEIGLFTKGKCVATAVAGSFVDTYFIEINAFYEIVDFYPKIKEIVEAVKDSCTDGNYTALDIHCYICKTLGHIAKNCKKISGNEENKKRWLERNLKSKHFNLPRAEDIAKRRIRRVYQKNSKINVDGKSRRPREMYPHHSRLVNSVYKYFNRSRASESFSNNYFIKLTEESMRSNSSMNLNLEQYDKFLDLSDEEQELVPEKIRDEIFDLGLIK